MTALVRKIVYGHVWCLSLLTLAGLIIALGINGIAIHHEFIAGGFSGLSLLLYYITGSMSPGIWMLVLNIPVFAAGLLLVSRRFFFYSLYGLLVTAFFLETVHLELPITDPFLAALTYGILLGAGMGISLRSFGSTGGLDIIGVILFQKFNIRIGQSGFFFNLILFGFGFMFLETDLVLYSLTSVFVTALVADYFMAMFNQRKMVLIITEFPESMSRLIGQQVQRGSTYLYGRGTYSGERKKIVLTVVNNFQLKRLEEIIFTKDPNAFVIIENTFNVLGKGFSKRMVF
ncbi:YitT family protein [Desulfonatronovibrio hydrogenovorans]|uniref:YitT family protein n=1 Tax=Desulfonatronovibrio hydrogenovorans TaxID=53245 RepID=UPI00068DABB7|nr:YitT family protein [Desulfonatronovibrio hydrogenovorans]